MKAVEDSAAGTLAPSPPIGDSKEKIAETVVAAWLRAVGSGDLASVRKLSKLSPQIIHAVGPHPFWGGRPQALHVSIETKRRDVSDILLAAGADIDGRNAEYAQWSPLMLTVHWKQPEMRDELLRRGAKIRLPGGISAEQNVARAILPVAAYLPHLRCNQQERGDFCVRTFWRCALAESLRDMSRTT